MWKVKFVRDNHDDSEEVIVFWYDFGTHIGAMTYAVWLVSSSPFITRARVYKEK